jgi:hypothetical protein
MTEEREREREKKKKKKKKKVRRGSERHYILGGARNYISGFVGSQALPARPSFRGNAYDRNYFL